MQPPFTARQSKMRGHSRPGPHLIRPLILGLLFICGLTVWVADADPTLWKAPDNMGAAWEQARDLPPLLSMITNKSSSQPAVVPSPTSIDDTYPLIPPAPPTTAPINLPGYPDPTAASPEPSPTETFTIAPTATDMALPTDTPAPTEAYPTPVETDSPTPVTTATITNTPSPSETTVITETARPSATEPPSITTTVSSPVVTTPTSPPPGVEDSPQHPMQQAPLIPQGVFLSLVVLLILFTGALCIRLWRGPNSGAE